MLVFFAPFRACYNHRPRVVVLFGIVVIAVYYIIINNVASDALIEALHEHGPITTSLGSILRISSEYRKHPISPPYQNQFWEVGQRSRRLSQWLTSLDGPWGSELRESDKRMVVVAIEKMAMSLFSFLKPPLTKQDTITPLRDLRRSFTKGSKGIVVSAGGSDLSVRFAGHLISSLRDVFGCTLPIQVAYAGEDDLPKHRRDALLSLDKTNNTEFLDVWTVFDDSTLLLRKGGWAIKPFAALASRFEHVIVLDADAVFLQSPEVLFQQREYVDTGAYLFHDRLLWQHAFQGRHEWWKDQIKEPSPAMNKSLVWTEDYAEECDSGVVVLDKSRPEVLVGLLHIAWQNTYDVREEVSYKITYGDKETWWLGLELAGSKYQFEAHYGSILGWEKEKKPEENAVCSFVIAHVDQKNKLLWYNGSLLKNKLADPHGYAVPLYWMMNGKWQKGGKKEMSCMVDEMRRRLTGEEIAILQRSIEAAIKVDEILGLAE
ncbi:glycosyltransferase family 71 [Trichoderma arundinaceum]|uniref:Glycosyltransferase family 71 n=1 Tax=Trichoderma arundinaceum TaxID=490622 RepID=A0A395NF10_TRIAR|nr:glycosyltransferase family 71 [Trichoderma arundinaceum]